jgi:hypothetical protein
MKKTITICATLLVVLFTFSTKSSNGSAKSDSVVLGPGYSNEAYYSFSTGVVKTSPRATWDIAFRTKKLSSSIITNDGSGVVLYTYPKADTSGWTSMDTIGLASWKQMFNDPADWENGAFSRNAKGHPDYGWGVYNMSTHNLTGDSLYIIKLRDGSLRKLWLVGKKSAANIYTFRYANMDGSNPKSVTLDLNNQVSADFYGYSLQTGEEVAFQPARTSWDVLFTKYMSIQPDGSPYLVVGVISNDTVNSKKFYPVPLTYSDFGAGIWDSTRSSIGWDWKKFDMGSFSYKIVDSTVYFVRPIHGDIYKLLFTAFTGSGSGIVRFTTEKAAGAGIADRDQPVGELKVFPNPASEKIFIDLTDINTNDFFISLSDLSGRQLRADRPKETINGASVYTMDVSGVQPGIYLVTFMSAATKKVAKVYIIR